MKALIQSYQSCQARLFCWLAAASRPLRDQRGQATVESALVWLVMAAVLLGFSALQKQLGSGLFVRHALESASHALGSNTAGTIGDVLLY